MLFNINESENDVSYRRQKYFTSKVPKMEDFEDSRNNFFNISLGNDGNDVDLANYLYRNYHANINFDNYHPLPFKDEYGKGDGEFVGPINLFNIETEDFYGQSEEEIGRITSIHYYNETFYDNDSKNFYVNNIIGNGEEVLFTRKNLLNNEPLEDGDFTDPHLTEVNIPSSGRDTSAGQYRGLRGEFKRLVQEDEEKYDHILFIDDLSDIEPGGKISNRFGKENGLKKSDYITTRYDEKTTYGNDNKSWYENFLDTWKGAILDRSSNMLSSLGDEYAEGLSDENYIDPHLIEYNSIENSTINLHHLGPKGEFYKLLSDKDGDNGNILFDAFNDLSLIQNPGEMNPEDVKKIANFEAKNKDSDILWRDLNPGNNVHTNELYIQPRYYGYSKTKEGEARDERYSFVKEEGKSKINLLIPNIDEIRVYSAPSVDQETPDPEQIGWHLEDPANGTDYDVLNNEEIKKASIGKAGSETLNSFNFFPNNDFDKLFRVDDVLGLVGIKQDLELRSWEDPEITEGNKQRPFALKKPLAVRNFYQPKVNDQEEEEIDVLGDQSITNNAGVKRASSTNSFIQDESGTRRDLLTNINLKFRKESNSSSHFKPLDDNGDETNSSDFDEGYGYIVALSTPNSSIANPIFHIPFEFNAEISGEQRAADWATETAVGRTSEFYIWSKTNTRTLQLKTTYIAVSPEGMDSAPDTNFDQLAKWTPSRVDRVINRFRTLILPLSTRLSSNLPVNPPIISIILNNYLLTASSALEKRYSRWVVQDINIDPKYEYGFTETRDPMGYDVTMTMKEVFDWKDIQSWEDIKGNEKLNIESLGE